MKPSDNLHSSTIIMFISAEHDSTYGTQPRWEVNSDGEKLPGPRQQKLAA
jgi:hypothetical protein